MRQEYSTTGVRKQETSRLKVRSPMEGQAHRRSGAACILGIGEIRGQGSLEKGKGLVLGEAKSEAAVRWIIVSLLNPNKVG